jgi:hypothetical protein
MHLCKNSIVDVLNLYIFWIIVFANCILSLYTLPSSHFQDDDECGSNLTTNDWMFSIPTLSTFLNYYYFIFFQQFRFLLLSPLSMLIFLRFLLLCYFLQFINHTICIHASVNSRISNFL